MRKITTLQKLTLILVALYFVWEIYVFYWTKNQPPSGAIIRVDLFIIYPILLGLIIVSFFQYSKKND